MAKMNKSGRAKHERIVILTHSILNSDAWRCLSTEAICLFVEIRKRFNGRNNGEISLSMREAAEVAKCSKSSASRHLNQLVEYGFIDLHNKGLMRNRHASTWFLTMEKSDTHPSYPTNRWRGVAVLADNRHTRSKQSRKLLSLSLQYKTQFYVETAKSSQ